jgi:hypothetical protein
MPITRTQGFPLKITKTKSDMSKAEAQIQAAIVKLKKITPPSKYTKQYNTYINGITLNKKIYTQAYLILKNTKSKDLENAINALYKYVSDSTAAYDAAKLGRSYIELPSDILTLPDKLHQFAFKSYNDYEAKNRLLEQYNAYFDSMDKMVKNYRDIQADMGSYVNSINNNTTTIANVYLEVEKKLNSLTDLQNSYLALTIPPKAVSIHQSFGDILKRYIAYCQDYKTTLTKLEEAGQDQMLIQEATFVFDELEIRYKEIAKAFTDFNEKYNGDKSMYSDSENL